MILHFCSPLGSGASVLFWPRRRKPHGSRVEGQLFRSFTSICDCGTSESLEESCSQDKEVLGSCLGQTSLIAPWRWTEAPKPSSKQNCSVLGETQVQTPTSTGERGWQTSTLLHLKREIGLLRTMIFLPHYCLGRPHCAESFCWTVPLRWPSSHWPPGAPRASWSQPQLQALTTWLASVIVLFLG